MYQAMSSRGYYHGRSCPICTRCFHRCSARIPAIPSSVVSRHGSRSDRPSKKPTVFRWGPPPPRFNRPSQPHFFLRLGSVGHFVFAAGVSWMGWYSVGCSRPNQPARFRWGRATETRPNLVPRPMPHRSSQGSRGHKPFYFCDWTQTAHGP